MYQIILIARIVDGTANAPRHLLYVILIFRSPRNRKLAHLGQIASIYTVCVHNAELFDRKIVVYR